MPHQLIDVVGHEPHRGVWPDSDWVEILNILNQDKCSSFQNVVNSFVFIYSRIYTYIMSLFTNKEQVNSM